jgi:hypothetical protein
MQHSDKQEFAKCLMGCSEIYGKEVSESSLSLWWSMLENYEISAIKSAFLNHMSGTTEDAKFMPKPTNIIALLNPKTTQKQDGLIAWGELVAHDFGYSNQNKITFIAYHDQAMLALRAIGGVCAFREATIAQRVWMEKSFIEHFEAQVSKMIAIEGGKSIDYDKISNISMVGSGY